MRLIALMLVRNEQWTLEASLDAALRWCDGAAILMDRCTDRSVEIADEISKTRKKPVALRRVDDMEQWDEMALRQLNLADGRFLGGTHFAIIDADEILTSNFLTMGRYWFEDLEPRQVLDVPMVAVWNDLDHYRVEDPTWSKAWLTLGFADHSDLTFRPADDGYQHHNRPPYGHSIRKRVSNHGLGGVMHLQFANQRRLLAKHVLYRMVDHLRWPGRDTVAKINWRYDLALQPKGRLEKVPDYWWGDYLKGTIDLGDVPYQEAEIHKMLEKYGKQAFDGLDLKGFA